MNDQDKEAFSHILGSTLNFYGKELDREMFAFWLSCMEGKNVTSIRNALLEYIKIGKFAPRPADILELILTGTQQHRMALPPPNTSTQCPPEVALAWRWFINRIASDTILEGIFRSDGPVDIETQERYLHIVNDEARHYNKPGAIPDEYKLAEVWG